MLPVIAGLLLPFCFAPFNWWPLLLPAIWLLHHTLRYDKPRYAALQGGLFGLAFFGVGVSWVFVSIHVHGNASVLLATFLTAFFVAGISLFPVLQFYLTARITAANKPLINALSFVCLWVIFEWFRSWFLTGFPWLLLGNAFIPTPLTGWAPITGVYGVTALAIVSALLSMKLLQSLWQQTIRRNAQAAATAIAIIWLSGWALQSVNWTTKGASFTVGMVQPDIAQADKWQSDKKPEITQVYLSMTESLWDKDLIIWPESALPYFKHQAEPLLAQLKEQALATNTTLSLGILSAEFDPSGQTRIYNSFMATGEGKGLYHKQKLVPFGEYVPLESLLRGLIDFFNLPRSHTQRGNSDQQALSFRAKKFIALICYEVVYPDFVADMAAGTQFLVTVSNDSWFGKSIGPHQHLQIAQMRALETQRYLLRATNNGITAIINPAGKLARSIPQFERALLTGEASFRSGSTPFMVTGSWPVLIIAGLTAFYCCAFRRSIKSDQANIPGAKRAGR